MGTCLRKDENGNVSYMKMHLSIVRFLLDLKIYDTMIKRQCGISRSTTSFASSSPCPQLLPSHLFNHYASVDSAMCLTEMKSRINCNWIFESALKSTHYLNANINILLIAWVSIFGVGFWLTIKDLPVPQIIFQLPCVLSASYRACIR